MQLLVAGLKACAPFDCAPPSGAEGYDFIPHLTELNSSKSQLLAAVSRVFLGEHVAVPGRFRIDGPAKIDRAHLPTGRKPSSRAPYTLYGNICTIFGFGAR